MAAGLFDRPPAAPVVVIAGGWTEPPAPPEVRSIVVGPSARPVEGDAAETRTGERGAEAGAGRAAELVRGRVERAIEEASRLSTDRQLEELEAQGRRLEEVSSAASIDRLADQFQTLLGTKRRAERPADEPVEGPFDFQTAQLHDVRRDELPGGKRRYRAELVDAEGRRMETEVDEATGEQLYRVFQTLRGNPLLEKVYRRIVMSFLDGLIERSEGRSGAGSVEGAGGAAPASGP